MSKENYDKLITDHYREVASKEGLEPSSTMADSVTREKETAAIIEFVGDALRRLEGTNQGKPPLIMDVGCGNGYTLEILTQIFPENEFVGIEKSDDLRDLAISRFSQVSSVSIMAGDIRDADFSRGKIADILICQRVLINLLDIADQRKTLSNIVNSVRPPRANFSGGALLFIEAFQIALDTLNLARNEFDLPPIGPAHHNLYLPDGFFDISNLGLYHSDGPVLPPNFLSTHYFVTRVLHPIFLGEKPFKRNSEFVKFFTQALKEHVGDYSPLRLMLLERIE